MKNEYYLIIAGVILLSRYFYVLNINILYFFYVSKNKELDKNEIYPSTNGLVYMLSLPAGDIKYYTSLPTDFRIEYDYGNLILPKLLSMKIYIRTNKKKKLIAIFNVEELKVPYLEKKLKEKKINRMIYEKIKIYIFLKKKFRNTVKFEVCKEIRKRNIAFENE